MRLSPKSSMRWLIARIFFAAAAHLHHRMTASRESREKCSSYMLTGWRLRKLKRWEWSEIMAISRVLFFFSAFFFLLPDISRHRATTAYFAWTSEAWKEEQRKLSPCGRERNWHFPHTKQSSLRAALHCWMLDGGWMIFLLLKKKHSLLQNVRCTIRFDWMSEIPWPMTTTGKCMNKKYLFLPPHLLLCYGARVFWWTLTARSLVSLHCVWLCEQESRSEQEKWDFRARIWDDLRINWNRTPARNYKNWLFFSHISSRIF